MRLDLGKTSNGPEDKDGHRQAQMQNKELRNTFLIFIFFSGVLDT